MVLEDNVYDGHMKLNKIPFSSLEGTASAVLDHMHTMKDKSMKMTYFDQNRIIGSIEVEKPSVVFFSIPYDIGWKVKVDDVKSDLIQADMHGGVGDFSKTIFGSVCGVACTKTNMAP